MSPADDTLPDGIPVAALLDWLDREADLEAHDHGEAYESGEYPALDIPA